MAAKKKVLLVDDNKEFSEFFRTAFEEEFELVISPDGEQGLEKCAEWRPDLVLLDVNLPGINGVEFMQRMSVAGDLQRIPVIVLTASDYNGLTESLMRRYVNLAAFMTKLSPMENIREKMLKAVEKK